jgi:hypothetical protein
MEEFRTSAIESNRAAQHSLAVPSRYLKVVLEKVWAQGIGRPNLGFLTNISQAFGWWFHSAGAAYPATESNGEGSAITHAY